MNTSAVEPVYVIWDARLTQFLAQSDDYGTDLLRHAARYSFSNMVAKIRIAAAAGNAGSLFPMMLVPFNNAGDFNELSYESLSTAPDRTDIAARTAERLIEALGRQSAALLGSDVFLRSVDESPLREKDKGAFADTFFDPAFIAARAVRITDTLLAELDQSAAAPDNKPEADS